MTHYLYLFTEAPFDQLPVLKVDDVTLCQSDAMEFYLAKKFGKNVINIFYAVCRPIQCMW